jgi:hypothetical protein
MLIKLYFKKKLKSQRKTEKVRKKVTLAFKSRRSDNRRSCFYEASTKKKKKKKKKKKRMIKGEDKHPTR